MVQEYSHKPLLEDMPPPGWDRPPAVRQPTFLRHHISQSLPRLSPRFFRRRSAGFTASFGISHILPSFDTPGIRLSSQSLCTRLSDIPHFFAASGQDIYSIPIRPFRKLTTLIIYGKPYNSNGRNMNYIGYIGELYRHIQKER